ncbi:MAG: glycoside hydrolase family 57 protein [Candidatus Diapherotrites archaeon]|nr:glycoside hydrolase family 57 protein [Candidatus Diapherotrites archaeon]
MTMLCFYFQVHQPMRIGRFTFFDIGGEKDYFDEKQNLQYLERIVRKCYMPTNRLILDLISETSGAFKVNFSITGTLLEQLEKHFPNVIESFDEMLASNCMELFCETYYHSLSFLISEEEFSEQVKMHREKIKEVFNVKPRVFRNTEAVYSNDIAKTISKLGFKAAITEGCEKILGWRSPNYLYKAKDVPLLLLLRNYRLSDDVAFRFSEPSWKEYPLTADKYAYWIASTPGDCINIFMDYETFGEHQWPETGIFEFLRALPKEIAKHEHLEFALASEIVRKLKPKDELSVPMFVSWADIDRDLSAWLENKMQRHAFDELKSLEAHVKKSKKKELIHNWRLLQTSDHFYYMCTKWFADGDVHKYFNPYETPYEAYINYMNVLNDLKARVGKG